MSEIWYRFSKRPDEYTILYFIRGFLDANEIKETTFWERLKILEKEGRITDKQSKKGNSLFLRGICSFCQMVVSTAVMISVTDPSYNPLLVIPRWNYPNYSKS